MAILDNLKELRDKYQDTYIGLKQDGTTELTPFKVESIEMHVKDKLYEFHGYRFINNSWTPDVIVDNLNTENIVNHPNYGLVNYKDNVIRIQRLPRKQWKLGFNSNIVRISSGNNYLDLLGIQSSHTINGPFLSACFNPVYFKLEEILSFLKEGKGLDYALSARFHVSVLPKFHRPLMFFMSYPCGEIINETVYLQPKFSFLLEEMSLVSKVKIYDQNSW